MSVQDKWVEMAVGIDVPDDQWLDHPRTHRVKRAHLELLQLVPLQDELILDAGCGPGTYGLILAEGGAHVVGIDISPEFVRKASERGKRKAARFSAQMGDLERLPYEDNSFQVCFCGWVLHHFPTLTPVVKELHRVLKPGGCIALAEPNESSAAARFSRFFEDMPLVRRWVLGAGWDTPNRASHPHRDYLESLAQEGFVDVKFSSCFPGWGLPPLPRKSQKRASRFLTGPLLGIAFHARGLVFALSARLLPGPLSGADLLIMGTKAGHTVTGESAAGGA